MNIHQLKLCSWLLAFCSVVPACATPGRGPADNRVSGGSMDGGGGNVIGSQGSTVEQVAAAVPELTFDLLLWLNGLDLTKANNPVAQILFRHGPLNKLEVFSKLLTAIEFRGKTYCQEQGADRDGSFDANATPQICISGLGIARRISLENLRAETFALLAHELAHALGASEDEAKFVQAVAKSDYIVKRKRDYDRFLGGLDATMVALTSINLDQPVECRGLYWHLFLEGARELDAAEGIFFGMDRELSTSVLDFASNYKNALMYACSQRKSFDPSFGEIEMLLANAYQRKYDRGDKTPRLDLLSTNLGDREIPYFYEDSVSKVWMTKIRSQSELEAVTQQLKGPKAKILAYEARFKRLRSRIVRTD